MKYTLKDFRILRETAHNLRTVTSLKRAVSILLPEGDVFDTNDIRGFFSEIEHYFNMRYQQEIIERSGSGFRIRATLEPFSNDPIAFILAFELDLSEVDKDVKYLQNSLE